MSSLIDDWETDFEGAADVAFVNVALSTRASDGCSPNRVAWEAEMLILLELSLSFSQVFHSTWKSI
jgi:hypothetical protein